MSDHYLVTNLEVLFSMFLVPPTKVKPVGPHDLLNWPHPHRLSFCHPGPGRPRLIGALAVAFSPQPHQSRTALPLCLGSSQFS